MGLFFSSPKTLSFAILTVILFNIEGHSCKYVKDLKDTQT